MILVKRPKNFIETSLALFTNSNYNWDHTLSLVANWFNGTCSDDGILAKTDKLANTKRGRKLLIITGNYAVQHYDYREAIRDPSFDVMIINFGYLLPEAENADWMFHGSMGYIKAFKNCMTFKYFCESFKGSHIFMTQTKHCAGGAYPITSKSDVITTLKRNNLKKWYIATHAYGNIFKSRGFEYVPTKINQFSPSKIPWGCGGTLNAMALPFAIQLGYSKIYMLGVGDRNLTHFYDVSFVQPHLRKPITLPYRNITLKRYAKWNALAKSNNTQLFVLPKKHTEATIQKVLTCVDTL